MRKNREFRCTPEQMEVICQHIRQGYSDAVAAASAGVSYHQLQLWLRRGFLVDCGELEESGENEHCYRLYLAYHAARAAYERQLTDLYHSHIRDLPLPLRVRYEHEMLARLNPRHFNDRVVTYEAMRRQDVEEAILTSETTRTQLDITQHIESIVLQALRELNKAELHQRTLSQATEPAGGDEIVDIQAEP